MDPGPWTPTPRSPPRWPSELPFAEMPSKSNTVSNKAGDHLLAAKTPGVPWDTIYTKEVQKHEVTTFGKNKPGG